MTRRNALFAVITVLTFVLFRGALIDLWVLSEHNEIYSYVLLMCPICLGLVYLRRRQIFSQVRYCYGFGIVILLAAGLLLYWLGQKHFPRLSQNDYLTLTVFGFVTALIGGFIFSYGGKALRTAAFPLSVLFLMVPIPEFLLDRVVLALQRGSAEITYALFTLSGVPVCRREFAFSLPGVTINIAQECSGIRSSLALLILSLVAGYVFLQSKWRRVFLSVIVIIAAVIKNGVRIVTLSLLAVYVDGSFLTGSLHRRYGGIVFSSLALAASVPVLWLLQRQEREYPESRSNRMKISGELVLRQTPSKQGVNRPARGVDRWGTSPPKAGGRILASYSTDERSRTGGKR